MRKIPRDSKKYYRERFRKIVENEGYGKISHFLIDVPKSMEILRKFLRNSIKHLLYYWLE